MKDSLNPLNYMHLNAIYTPMKHDIWFLIIIPIFNVPPEWTGEEGRGRLDNHWVTEIRHNSPKPTALVRPYAQSTIISYHHCKIGSLKKQTNKPKAPTICSWKSKPTMVSSRVTKSKSWGGQHFWQLKVLDPFNLNTKYKHWNIHRSKSQIR